MTKNAIGAERRQKMEDVLAEINKHAMFTAAPGEKMDAYRFAGAIHDNIKFQGIWFREHEGDVVVNEDAQVTLEHFDEHDKRTVLGLLALEKGFVERKIGNKIRVNDTTEFMLVSPYWRANAGKKTTTYASVDMENQPIGTVRVFHSPAETSEAVVDRLYNAVVKNKINLAELKKLSKLNLAPKSQTADRTR